MQIWIICPVCKADLKAFALLSWFLKFIYEAIVKDVMIQTFNQDFSLGPSNA